ncbi:hypothetical protein RhiirC2_767920 [Rhizophagus irregularis]|uniref:Uncharacterized protein n=1 Tax=Rhizophagus irregularis TaxID=588596 RepID=A0A2N1P308_9GLOM|nr:hypothetical protein RhiirC2_767920 [Rhizophagus irregularis]
MDEGLALLFDEPKEETLMESFDKKTLNKEDKLPFTRENSQSRCVNVITWNSGDQPDGNEIFSLKQSSESTPVAYVFRQFANFYRNKAIEIPTESIGTVGGLLKLGISTNGDNQRFSIECDTCNLNTNSASWNLASKLCANGKDIITNVTQTDCVTASKWDLFGIMSPDVPLPATTSSADSPTIANSTGVISVGGLVAAVLGSIIGTAIISFMAGYWVIKRKQFSKNELLIKNDPVNVQVIHG